MKLKDRQIKKIAELILQGLKEKKLVTLRKKEFEVLESIAKVITDDMEAEAKLERDARSMMDAYRTKINSGEIDERKVFLMIKKQLAKERKIVL